MLGRLAYAVLVGVVTFVVLSVIGTLLKINLVIAYAGVIGLLAGIVTFFTRPVPPTVL